MARLGVVGTTSWGTTLGVLLAESGHSVALWARTEAEAAQLAAAGENARFLPGVRFPEALTVTASAEQALGSAELVLFVTPSITVEQNAHRVASSINPAATVISAAKGIDARTGRRMSQVIAGGLGGALEGGVGALSGPNLAGEIAQGKPASATVACEDAGAAERAQAILNSRVFRVYTSSDLIGVELGGALKNIVAIGAGIIDGLGLGNNAKSGFVTRGLAEITRLGVAMGARAETFAGLSGMGDLITTCYSGLSRNRYVGEQLARGRPTEEIVAGMDQTAEGIPTTAAAVAIAESLGVEMPIAQATKRVLAGDLSPQDAINELMSRAPAPETG